MLSGKMQVSSYKVTFIWSPKMERTVWGWVSQAKKTKRADTADAVSAKAQRVHGTTRYQCDLISHSGKAGEK